MWVLLSDSSELRMVWQCSEEWLYRNIMDTLGKNHSIFFT